MNNSMRAALTLVLLSGCVHWGGIRGSSDERMSLWTEAHQALAERDFERAESLFERISDEHPETLEGREGLFYLGALRMDPRNPQWDTEQAQTWLDEYLDLNDDGGPRLYRYPEALTLREIAHQLNLPPESRMSQLRPEERVVTVEQPVEVPTAEAQNLQAENDRLRQQVAEREARIREQQEEIDRIRRTLTGAGRQ